MSKSQRCCSETPLAHAASGEHHNNILQREREATAFFLAGRRTAHTSPPLSASTRRSLHEHLHSSVSRATSQFLVN